MNKKNINYLGLIILFNQSKNKSTFIDEINSLLNNYFRIYINLTLKNKIILASKTGISSIRNKVYQSFEDLKSGIIFFPPDTIPHLDDFELYIMIILRCGLVYENENENENENDFIKSIKKIDEFIESFTYDEIFKIPDFFLNIKDKNITEYESYNMKDKIIRISKNSINYKNKNKLVFNHDILSDNINVNSGGSLDNFIQKKIFYDLNTEFISREEIFNDSKQDLIFKFQYLINNFFNKFIKIYIDKNKLEEDDILFIFKGGTFMKILYEKYNILLKKNKNFMDNNREYFKRSDSDYSLYINPKFDKENYTKHFYYMNVLIYNILNYIKLYIGDNLFDLLPIDKISEESLKIHLEKLNTNLKSNKDKLSYFKDIEEFIGVSICDKNYFSKSIPDNFNIYMLNNNDIMFTHGYDNFDGIDMNDSLIENKKDFFKINKFVKTIRGSFYITSINFKNKYYPELIYLPDNFNNSGIFQYYNETNRFTTFGGKLNYFFLHRLKINMIIYFRTKDSYGFFSSPAELIDIPIVTYHDFKKIISFDDSIKKYTKKLNNRQLIFNSYTLYGVINDLFKSLFVELEMPWEVIKYDKKIFRLSFFFMIYFNNHYNNNTILNIQKKLNIFLENFNRTNAKNLKFYNYDKKIVNDDSVYDILINNLYNLKNIVDKNKKKSSVDKNIYLEENFNKFKSILKINIDLLLPELINNLDPYIYNNSELIPYLKKYLKTH